MSRDYVRDGAAIYAESFATIRREANLAGFSAAEARVAVRVIHACGMVEVAQALRFHSEFCVAARGALLAGRPVLCDAKMVAHGVTRARLPGRNEVVCTLDAAEVPGLAKAIGNTRSAAALDLWGERMAGSLVAIGNAPTALFRLLEMLDAGAAAPAAIIGVPVGFVGAAESKAALAAYGRVPYLIVEGRRGGSAMAAAARECARERNGMSGTFHVVGLGPGDPELMTLKAARVIAGSPVVAYFAKRGRTGHARTIAGAHIGADAEELRFEYPFTTEIALDDPRYRAEIVAFYDECAGVLAERLSSGRDAVLLCEGDPFFYGSSMYLFDRLRAGFRAEVVPGVSAMSGCWSRAHLPIAHGDDVLTVLPGTLDEEALAARLTGAVRP